MLLFKVYDVLTLSTLSLSHIVLRPCRSAFLKRNGETLFARRQTAILLLRRGGIPPAFGCVPAPIGTNGIFLPRF